MAIEATTEPVLVVLLLLWLERTRRLDRYGSVHGVAAGALVGLITYSYTGSRLLGPLLAAALVVFGGRGRWRFVVLGLGRRSRRPRADGGLRASASGQPDGAIRGDDHRPGRASPGRPSSSRASGTGSATSIPGTGRRPVTRPRTSTTAATARCSAALVVLADRRRDPRAHPDAGGSLVALRARLRRSSCPSPRP